MHYLITAVLSYLLGSFSTSYFLALRKGVDLRKYGTGNLGASNTAVTLGFRTGVLVALVDILKGIIAVAAARSVFLNLESIGELAGMCAVLGHIFPFYLGFRGGKGFAAYVGAALALNWKLAVCVIVLALMITVLSDYIALAALTVATVVPLFLLHQNPGWVLAAILLPVTAVIYGKHVDNLSRIFQGTEIGLRSTLKGKHRVK